MEEIYRFGGKMTKTEQQKAIGKSQDLFKKFMEKLKKLNVDIYYTTWECNPDTGTSWPVEEIMEPYEVSFRYKKKR